MANMLDYVKWRGDISFSEHGVNEVDSLIFSTIAYFNMEGYVLPEPRVSLTIPELVAASDASPNDQKMTSADPMPLMRLCASSRRYRDVKVGAYVTDVDAERGIQFCAVTFWLDDSSVFVSYRGTDKTIVGWREDFDLAYMTATPGQLAARDYLDMIGRSTDAPLYVGGHSKGGNFAVYAASFCSDETQKRIVRVFSNDGPGFNEEVSALPGYAAISGRISKVIPDSSLVGTLLTALEKPKIIKSSLRGPIQHDPFSWQVEGTSFVPVASRSSGGTLYDNAFSKWLSTFDRDGCERFVNSLFGILEASGLTTLNELVEKKWIPYNAILKAVKNTSPSEYREVIKGAGRFAAASRETVWNKAKLSFEERKKKNSRKNSFAPSAISGAAKTEDDDEERQDHGNP